MRPGRRSRPPWAALAELTRRLQHQSHRAPLDGLVYGLFAARCLLGPQLGLDHPVLGGPEGLGVGLQEAPDLWQQLAGPLDEILADTGSPDLDSILQGWSPYLQALDPDRRRRGGVYMTPPALALAMVERVDAELRRQPGSPHGLASRGVHILDPSMGTGIFVVSILDRVLRTWLTELAPAVDAAAAWRRFVRSDLLPRLHAVELDASVRRVACVCLRHALAVVLPERHGLDPEVWGVDLGEQSLDLRGADTLTLGWADLPPLTVIVGNPPYERISESQVPNGLLDDLLVEARAHTIFSHHASLYDRYVLFWRWSLRQSFEAHDAVAIVSLVTNRAWLTGPGFIGLRRLARDLADRVLIEDLGGDVRGAAPASNVFGIGTPVSVVTLVRGDPPHGNAAVHYRRSEGSDGGDPAWRQVSGHAGAPLVPAVGGDDWLAMPSLAQLFPWRHPGCKVGRLWPISPDPQVLVRRWRRLLAEDVDGREIVFCTRSTGRTVHSRVGGRTPLAELPADAPVPAIVPYGYRSFDRQWLLDDPRLAALERPPLWAVRSPRQRYLVAPMTKATSAGPCLVAFDCVPDLDAFRGSFGGKDVLPLFRDADGCEPNLPAGLLEVLGAALGHAVSAEELADVVLAILSGRAYQAHFSEALQTPGPRVPLPRDPELWSRAAGLGRQLWGLHTGLDAGSPESPSSEVSWDPAPVDPPERISYDGDRAQILVGDGRLCGVPPEVWDYAVSGMRVLKKWLGYRTRRGAGRAARSGEALDAIRSERWLPAWSGELVGLVARIQGILEIEPVQAELLQEILSGPRFTQQELPEPTPTERRSPKM